MSATIYSVSATMAWHLGRLCTSLRLLSSDHRDHRSGIAKLADPYLRAAARTASHDYISGTLESAHAACRNSCVEHSTQSSVESHLWLCSRQENYGLRGNVLRTENYG